MTSKLSGTKEQILIPSPFLWTRNRDSLAGCSASRSLMGLQQASAGPAALADDAREAGRLQAHVGGCCTFSFSLPVAQRSPRSLSSPTWQLASSGHFRKRVWDGEHDPSQSLWNLLLQVMSCHFAETRFFAVSPWVQLPRGRESRSRVPWGLTQTLPPSVSVLWRLKRKGKCD